MLSSYLLPFTTVYNSLCLSIPQLVCPCHWSPWSPFCPWHLPWHIAADPRCDTDSDIISLSEASTHVALLATGSRRWPEVKTLHLVEDVHQMF